MQKVHCRECGLYLGSTNEEDFPIQITCPICEDLHVRLRDLFGQSTVIELEFPNDMYMSWTGEVMAREVEDMQAFTLVRLMTEGREGDFYEFRGS